MPTGVEEAILAGLGALKYLDVLFAHPLIAYLFLLLGLSITTAIQGLTGFGLTSVIISAVMQNVFHLQGFIWYDWQTLILFALFPFAWFGFKYALTQAMSN